MTEKREALEQTTGGHRGIGEQSDEEFALWWEDLGPDWQEIFLVNLELEAGLTEELAKLRNIWSTSRENYRRVFGQEFIPDPSQAGRVVGLRKVDCYGTEVQEIPRMPRGINLDEFYCGSTAVSSAEPLRDQRGLRKLCLYNTRVNSLEPLRGMTRLRRLCCSNTRVDDLSPLRDLNDLEVLSCYNTPVSSLRPIWGLPRLRRLRCYGTMVSEAEVAEFVRDHPRCRVYYRSEEGEPEYDDFMDEETMSRAPGGDGHKAD
jgi:hypothetical protein